LDPTSPDALFNLGNVYLAEKHYAAAIDSYNGAVALSPVQADVYNNLGLAYSEWEQPEGATKSFLRAIELDPSHAEAHFNFGRALAKQKTASSSDRKLRQGDNASTGLCQSVS
jgi:Tfp pilus assembly protein PilF